MSEAERIRVGIRATKQFDRAFELKEAGHLDEALKVWGEADAALQTASYTSPAVRAYALMHRGSVLGAIQRQRRCYDDSTRAYDAALAAASSFYKLTSQLELAPPWYEPPANIPIDSHNPERRLVAQTLAALYYNKAQVHFDMDETDTWTRFQIYALDVCLQILRESTSELTAFIGLPKQTPMPRDIKMIAKSASLAELTCRVATKHTEKWVFLSCLVGHLARRSVNETVALSKFTDSIAFESAARSLHVALALGLMTSEEWHMLVTAGFAFIDNEISELRQFARDLGASTSDHFQAELLDDMHDDMVAYVMLRLLLHASAFMDSAQARRPGFIIELAARAYQMGMREEAIHLLESISAAERDRLPPLARAIRATYLANAYSDTGRSTAATAAYQEALDLLVEPAQQVDATVVRANIVNDALLSGDPERSYDLARQALEALSPDNRSKGRALLLLNMGAAATHLGDLEEAERRFLEAVDLGRTLEAEEPLLHQALEHLSVLMVGERRPQAAELLDEAIALSRELGHFRDLARYLYRRANLYDADGQIADAVLLFREALDVARRSDDAELQMEIIVALAGIYYDQYDDENAAAYYREGLNLAQKVGRRPMEMLILSSLATVYRRLGRYDEAEQCRADEARLASTSNEDRLVIDSLNNRAVDAYARADLIECIRLADQALELAEERGDHRAAAQALMIMGNVALAGGGHHEAIALHQEALREVAHTNEGRLMVKIRGSMGLAYALLGERELAETHLRAAIAQARDLGQPAMAASWAYQYAIVVDEKFADPPAALALYHEIIDLLDEVRKDRELAADMFGPIGMLDNPEQVYRRAAHLARQLGRSHEAFITAERSRSRQFLNLLSQSWLGQAPSQISLEEERLRRRKSAPGSSGDNPAGLDAIITTELGRVNQDRQHAFYEGLARQPGASAEYAALRLGQPITYTELQTVLRSAFTANEV